MEGKLRLSHVTCPNSIHKMMVEYEFGYLSDPLNLLEHTDLPQESNVDMKMHNVQ